MKRNPTERVEMKRLSVGFAWGGGECVESWRVGIPYMMNLRAQVLYCHVVQRIVWKEQKSFSIKNRRELFRVGSFWILKQRFRI